MAVNKVVYGNQTLVDLTEDTVTPETLAVGVTAHDKSGNIIVGTMQPSHYEKKSGTLTMTSGSTTTLTLDLTKPSDLAEVYLYKSSGTIPNLAITSLSASYGTLDTVELVQATVSSSNTQKVIAGATQLSIVVKPNGNTFDVYYQFYNGNISALVFAKSMQSGSAIRVQAINTTSGWSASVNCKWSVYLYNTTVFKNTAL